MPPAVKNSKIVRGKIMHHRFFPTEHKFEYPVYYYLFNLTELVKNRINSFLFGYNKKRLVSIHDNDYLIAENADIKSKLLNLLDSFSVDNELEDVDIKNLDEILLVTNCRYFGHVFNPASFFYCYDKNGSISLIVVEINNTFEERHIYILTEPLLIHGKYCFQKEKTFHVSPFFSREGQYKFRFSDIREKLDIAMDFVQNNKTVFTSRVWGGKYADLNTANILSLITSYPLNTFLTIPRIYWQAMRLYFQKKLPVFLKPNIMSEKTIYAYPFSWIDRICMKFALNALKKLSGCKFTVIFPDSSIKHFGDVSSSNSSNENIASHNSASPSLPRVIIKLNNFNVFKKFIFKGAIGFGESYVENDWDSPDLPELLKVILNN